MEPIRQRSNPKPSSSNRSSERWIEVHLYRHGRGPISIFRSSLVGPGLDRLNVRSILSKYGLRSLFAFKPPSERGFGIGSTSSTAEDLGCTPRQPAVDDVNRFGIRFDKANGLSVLRYKPGSVVFFDSEPKGSLIRTISLIFMGLAIPSILIMVLMNELPYQFKSTTLIGSFVPPWLLAFGVILYSRLRKKPRT
ncbi:Eukaryotic translation initiation factor 3 subunit C [Rhynchospora pubera]|uniref:Eukaryotic translation initiation factor 3 subunit C n=1 Tax=Rhynchospora pubera TaxID=906938 RepID=A0AAV8HPZ6_9POAL|nr:Eukaryotic translation initiation factor 3 subunit C [Rhynchospora pubera]